MDRCNCWATHDGPSYFCPLHGEIKNELVEAEPSQETPQADVALNDLLAAELREAKELISEWQLWYTYNSSKMPNGGMKIYVKSGDFHKRTCK